MMLSSSSSSSACASAAVAAFFLLLPAFFDVEAPFAEGGAEAVGVPVAAGRSSSAFLVCWPLVARPERRGSSVRKGD